VRRAAREKVARPGVVPRDPRRRDRRPPRRTRDTGASRSADRSPAAGRTRRARCASGSSSDREAGPFR
jgi:hypothetical protein